MSGYSSVIGVTLAIRLSAFLGSVPKCHQLRQSLQLLTYYINVATDLSNDSGFFKLVSCMVSKDRL